MQNMFVGCSSLISLDLSSFNTEKVSLIRDMFNGCSNLKYINLKNFKLSNSLNYSNIIKGIPYNVRACINKTMALYLYGLINN